jgi:hypothetical protein
MTHMLDLGGRRLDLTHRGLVMGILNRTPDSFYDKGATFSLDAFYTRAEALVADGADILDVGGVKAGPGPEVTESEEIDRVVSAVAGLVSRFPTPVSVDTWRASVARLSYKEGALMGNDISGFADPDYLAAAAEFGAAVVATHIRLAPRVADPEPHYDDVVADVGRFLSERADGGAVAHASPGLVDLGRAGLSAPPVRLEQDLSRPHPRPRADRARAGISRGGRARDGVGVPDSARAQCEGHLSRPRCRRRGERSRMRAIE